MRSLSVTPKALPEIKKIIRSVNMSQCSTIARKVMAMDNATEIDRYLLAELRKVVPELAVD